MPEEDKRGVVFRPSFYEAIKPLPNEDRLAMYDAVVKYGLEGETPKLEGILQSLFVLMKPNIDASQKNYLTSVENGKKGGRPPKNPAITQQKPSNNPAITQQKPSNNHDIDIDIDTDTDIDTATAIGAFAAADVSREFLNFWDKYPNKVNQSDALAAWNDIHGDQCATQIIAGLERWNNSLEWEKDNGRYIPRPAKWLREQRWQEYPKEKIPMGATGQLGTAELEAIQRLLNEDQ